jgi:hypothetical protein
MLGLAALVIVCVGATPASADHFKPLSPNHTSYGVGQLNYGNLPAFLDFIVKLINPVHVTQGAAVIVYESDRSDQAGTRTPEKYLTCQVRKLTPHASISITQEVLFPGGENVPSYAEVIWAPADKVSPGQGNGQNRRIADGLGGFSYAGRDIPTSVAHPGLFSLPSNDVVGGQREAAITCVCAGLAVAGLSADVFSEFGITCP